MKIGKYGEAITAWNRENRVYIEDIHFKPGIKPMLGADVYTEMLADPLVWNVAEQLYNYSNGVGPLFDVKDSRTQDFYYIQAETIVKIVKEGLED